MHSKSTTTKKGFDLFNCEQRLNDFNGYLEIEGCPHRGAVVIINVSLELD